MNTPAGEQLDRLADAFPRCAKPDAWRAEALRCIGREPMTVIRAATDSLIATWKSHERPSVAKILQCIALSRRTAGMPEHAPDCGICQGRKVVVSEVVYVIAKDGLAYTSPRPCPRCCAGVPFEAWVERECTEAEYEAIWRAKSQAAAAADEAVKDRARRDVLTLTRSFATQLRERGVQSIDALIEHVDSVLMADDAAQAAAHQNLSDFLNEPEAADGRPAGRKRTAQATALAAPTNSLHERNGGGGTKPAPAGGGNLSLPARPVSDLFPERTA